MIKRALCIILTVLLVASLAMSLTGCKKVSEEEAVNLVKSLVSRSYNLNVVYYGKGLKYKESGNPNQIYLPVLENEVYVLRSVLIKDTYEVFSETLATSVINMAFGGVSSETGTNGVQSRYMVEGDDDWLLVNKDYKGVKEEIAQYNYDTIEITKISRRFINANIKTTKGENVEIVLIKQGDNWRLDSITC